MTSVYVPWWYHRYYPQNDCHRVPLLKWHVSKHKAFCRELWPYQEHSSKTPSCIRLRSFRQDGREYKRALCRQGTAGHCYNLRDQSVSTTFFVAVVRHTLLKT